ncbi:MAG TPA: hypothetical protein VGD07_13555 [Methylomirabilota bacterium]|jgi:hypothetical protein
MALRRVGLLVAIAARYVLAGALGHATKPLNPEDLVDLIARLPRL